MSSSVGGGGGEMGQQCSCGEVGTFEKGVKRVSRSQCTAGPVIEIVRTRRQWRRCPWLPSSSSPSSVLTSCSSTSRPVNHGCCLIYMRGHGASG